MTSLMHWERLIGAAVLLGIGVFGGMRLAPEPEPAEPVAVDDKEPELNDLDLARLHRLGVEIGPIGLTDFQSTVPIPAVLESLPESHRTVHAPIGGRVTKVHVGSGQRVDVGEPLVTLLREPLPRPSLTITANVLTPAQESVHEVIQDLRRRALEVTIGETEIERVEKLQADAPDGLAVFSPQRLVDLRYELRRAKNAAAGAREEAEKHGLSNEQIAAVIEGAHGPAFDGGMWRAALTRNGLWTPAANTLFDALPEAMQAEPWAVATVGELVASGLAGDGLTEWLTADPTAATHFLDVGVLLQRGHSLEDLKAMHGLGAFEPIVTVRASGVGGAESYDIDALGVQPGAVVAAGDALLEVDDVRLMRLVIEGVGTERAHLARAAEFGTSLRATPLIDGVAPTIEDVTISYVRGDADGGSVGHALVENSVLHESQSSMGREGAQARYRTWALRSGQRFLVHVPRQDFKNVYVLPASAVFREAGEPHVLVKEGDHFHPHPVVVSFRDQEFAIVAPAPGIELVVGSQVALKGAREILQALRADVGGGGHGHDHGHAH